MCFSRTSIAANARGLVLLSLTLGPASLCSAAIVYDVNQTVGVGNVTGFIETTGVIGLQGNLTIVDWNLLLNDGTATFDLLGPMSGSNSVLGFTGNDLFATATQLLFNFSGSDGGYILFQSPKLFTGSDFWCLASSNQGCSSEPVGETINVFPDANQFTSVTGTQVIAAVPEPSSFTLLGIPIVLIGFRKLWAKQQSC